MRVAHRRSGRGAPAQLDVSHPYGSNLAEDGTPRRGGTLNVGVFTDTPSFDPRPARTRSPRRSTTR
ncbi:hypothetical protein BJF78_03760 [Pseudonocardia sp. CNS-139]|nr:hypothetical protein BJF78_03760 [Pseudonocardia sp. CNS-139]